MFDGSNHRCDRRTLDASDPPRMLLRTRRFEGFQSALGITRHLLAERLKKLVRQAAPRRIPYQESPKRHEDILTQKGLDLYPIMMALVHWGDTHMVEERGRPLLHQHRKCGKIFNPAMVCPECGEPLLAKEVHVHPGPGARAQEAFAEDQKRPTVADHTDGSSHRTRLFLEFIPFHSCSPVVRRLFFHSNHSRDRKTLIPF